VADDGAYRDIADGKRVKQRAEPRLAHSDEQAARSLRIGEEEAFRLAEPIGKARSRRAEIEIAACAAGAKTIGEEPLDVGQQRRLLIDDNGAQRLARGFARGTQHIPKMTQQTKTGHIGGRIHANLHHRFGGGAVERCHRAHGILKPFARQPPALCRCRQDASAYRLRQHKRVAYARAGIADDSLWVHRAGDEKAEFGLLVDDGMAAGNGDASLGADRRRPLEETRKRIVTQSLYRPGDEAQCIERLSAHRIHVAQRICRGNAAVIVGIVDNRRKNIDRLDQRKLIREPHDGCVIACSMSDENARIIRHRETCQGQTQICLADLGSAACRTGERGERYERFHAVTPERYRRSQ